MILCGKISYGFQWYWHHIQPDLGRLHTATIVRVTDDARNPGDRCQAAPTKQTTCCKQAFLHIVQENIQR
jgi:hypothetical protein